MEPLERWNDGAKGGASTIHVLSALLDLLEDPLGAGHSQTPLQVSSLFLTFFSLFLRVRLSWIVLHHSIPSLVRITNGSAFA